ncbi:hypothetical protein D3C81_1187840 [compost metagenome]
MTEDPLDHELSAREAARVIAHTAFLAAGAGRCQFQGALSGRTEQQLLFEEVRQNRRQTGPVIKTVQVLFVEAVGVQPMGVAGGVPAMKPTDLGHGLIEQAHRHGIRAIGVWQRAKRIAGGEVMHSIFLY